MILPVLPVDGKVDKVASKICSAMSKGVASQTSIRSPMVVSHRFISSNKRDVSSAYIIRLNLPVGETPSLG